MSAPTRRALATALLTLALSVHGAARAGQPATDPAIAGLLARMTLEEKVSLMAGDTEFSTPAIPRLGIPALRMADGPNGIRSNETDPATVFPSSVAMASTWDRAMVSQVAGAIGQEARALRYQVVLGPAMNIQRTPLGGRSFEYFSEDPFLTGAVASAWIEGLQAQGVGATPKHFVANNQEHERKRVSANVDERTLREIYTAGFQTAITQAHPWALMTGYNRLNGTYTSQHRWLLHDLAKGEWGFDGVVMSDWGAVHDTVASARNGLDLEMPGPPQAYGAKLVAAVRAGQVPSSAIDASAGRVLRLMMRTGLLDAQGHPATPAPGVLGGAAHDAISRRAATEAVVLLKNDHDVLPLDPARLKTLAVIGPNADTRVIQGGGSSEVLPLVAVTGLEGIRAALGDKVQLRVARGADNDRYAPTADPRMFSPDLARTRQGLRSEYWTDGRIAGAPKIDRPDQIFQRFYFGFDLTAHPATELAIRWTGYFWPTVSGDYDFQVLDKQNITLTLDGRTLMKPRDATVAPPLYDFLKWRARHATVHLEAGKGYPIEMDFTPGTTDFLAYRIGVRLPPPSIDEAVKAATGADAAIVFVGSSNTSESEGQDRTDMKLLGQQDALVEAVVRANPNTIVVLNNGGPMAMPWLDQVPAVLESWFIGGQTGNALADLIFGKANPSGKLPMTFPRRLQDNPSYAFYPGKLESDYGEGVYVGYRWYDKTDIAPLFPFGHGLSYTHYTYGPLRVTRGTDGQVQASVQLTNRGTRTGCEVAQLYVAPPQDGESRPLRALRGFDRVCLAPGEQGLATFSLTPRDFAYFDVRRGGWLTPAGHYGLEVGASSRDLRAQASLQVADAFVPVQARYRDGD